MSTHLRTDSPVPQSTLVPAAPPRKTSGKALAAMLLAALVSALIVAADSIVDTYADGHLLVGWISLWALGFAALGLLANTARRTAERLSYLLGSWGQRRVQKRSDAYLLALAQHDPRIMAEYRPRYNAPAQQRDRWTRHLGRPGWSAIPWALLTPLIKAPTTACGPHH